MYVQVHSSLDNYSVNYFCSSLLVQTKQGSMMIYRSVRIGKYKLDEIKCCQGQGEEQLESVADLLTVWNDK